MSTKNVRYWKRIGLDTYEPHSTSAKERNLLMHYRDEKWCRECKAVVEPDEMILRGSGFEPVCPFCETPTG